MDQLVFDRLIINRNKRDIIVDLNLIDFSDGNRKKPIEIYCQGFGHRVDILSEFDNLLIKKEAAKLNATFVTASIRNIPPSFDSQSLRRERPSFGVDARIILEALKKKSLEVVKRPVIITGFSEGAGVALAIAGEIDTAQKDRYLKDLKVIPENKLRLLSLTNVIELEKEPKGTTIARNFIKEVSKIALIETVERYGFITGEEVFIKDREDAVNFFTKLAKYLSNVKNWKDVKNKMKLLKEENVHLLKESFGKIITAKSVFEAVEQLKKMEYRSRVCTQLGRNWEIRIVIPVNDSIYPWNDVKKTLRELQKSEVEEIKSIKDIEKVAEKLLFPNAGMVAFKVVGKNKDFIGTEKGDKGLGLADVHVGLEDSPLEYYNACSFVR